MARNSSLRRGFKSFDFSINAVPTPSKHYREQLSKVMLGDDVYGDDPTANDLQAKVAQLFGKEAGLIFPSALMGNITALMMYCGRDITAYLGANSTLYNYHSDGLTTAGVKLKAYDDGNLIDLPIPSQAKLEPVCFSIENPYSLLGDSHWTTHTQLTKLKKSLHPDTVLHLDGTRIFSAYSQAKGVDPEMTLASLTSHYDSVVACFTTGLGCPSGGILLGTTKFISEARRGRKLLGGGMRQVGVMIASVSTALENIDTILEQQTDRSNRLATVLKTCDFIHRIEGHTAFRIQAKGDAVLLHKKLGDNGLKATLTPDEKHIVLSVAAGLDESVFEEGLTILKSVLSKQ